MQNDEVRVLIAKLKAKLTEVGMHCSSEFITHDGRQCISMDVRPVTEPSAEPIFVFVRMPL